MTRNLFHLGELMIACLTNYFESKDKAWMDADSKVGASKLSRR